MFYLSVFTLIYIIFLILEHGANAIHLGDLHLDLMRDWKIQNTEPFNLTDFKKTVRQLGITESLQSLSSCTACHFLIKEIQDRTLTVEVIGKAICNIYFLLQTWKASSFCSDIIQLHLPMLSYIIKNSHILEPKYACSILLQNPFCYYESEPLTWSIEVSPESQKREPRVDYSDPTKQPLRIIQISDFHITPDYEINTSSTCGFPLCCKQGLASNLHEVLGRKKSGKWGDYNCDIPLWLFDNMLQHINEYHKDIDIIYFTGDIVDHSVWQTSADRNSKIIYWAYEQFYNLFPNKILLPLIGNHETSPINNFSPIDPDIVSKNISTQWLYTLMSELWAPWLPKEALDTVKNEGYYAFNVNDKLKVIGLNSNVCYNYNWWLLYDTTFLVQQLSFLKNELEESERRGQFVHILAHIPPGNKECIQPWEKSYNSLIRRFSNIIKGQFYGHEHTDELKVFYDKDNETPINVGWNGGSVTPYQNYNPNYKIMTIDPYTYDMIDIDTYIFNLTDANLHPNNTPVWFRSYSMKEAYGLDDLSPRSIHRLAEKMFTDEETYCKYWRNYVSYGDASLKSGCKRSNRKEVVCKIITAESLSPPKEYCK